MAEFDELVNRITRNVMRRLAEEEGPEGKVSLPIASVNHIISAGADRIGATLGAKTDKEEIARTIDHTYLKPDATVEKITQLCEEAKKYNFATVCINPNYVALSSRLLKDTPVKVTCVVGFPLGATTSTAKAMETRDAIANGADEIDMVMNIGALKSKNYDLVKKDIQAVVNAANGRTVKVILETALLTQEEKIKACQITKEAGADFVKTSTGFGPSGATVADVALMRRIVGPIMGVKAAGGIHTFEEAQALIKAGATRIGASASVAIIKGTPTTAAY